jgi:hypothetical protein
MTLRICYITIDVEQIPYRTNPWTTESRGTDAHGAERPDDIGVRLSFKSSTGAATQRREAQYDFRTAETGRRDLKLSVFQAGYSARVLPLACAWGQNPRA